QNLKRDHKFGPATRVLMWRITRKCGPSLNELLDMATKKLVPEELHEVAVAILAEYCKAIDSDRAMVIYRLLQGPLGVHSSLSLQFLKQAAKTNTEAQMEYGDVIMNDPHSSQNEIQVAVEELISMARRKNVPAMLKLTDYYRHVSNKHQQFVWLWVMRGLFESTAQAKLQVLTNSITKQEFASWKIEGEALLDEVKFKNDPGNYSY
ncbi:MAG: hypothetical protein EBU90_22845, partial [Proteobacteria bacterium]|nr:hypothetical protein [Pseudomonadota bacterium]